MHYDNAIAACLNRWVALEHGDAYEAERRLEQMHYYCQRHAEDAGMAFKMVLAMAEEEAAAAEF